MTHDSSGGLPFDPGAPVIAGARRLSVLGKRPVRRRGTRMTFGVGLAICLMMTVLGLGAAASLGGLRPIDLAAAAFVMVGVILLGVRDHRHLPMAVMATWFYAPLGRRVVDWLSGGYVSITAMSLLPLLASSALLIPLAGRIGAVPRRLRQPLVLLALPPVLASSLGFFWHGPGALAEAGQWLLPLLFVPYLAVRPLAERDALRLSRAVVLLSASSAVYGIYQFFALPAWDALWLVQSSMTSSMGQAEVMQMRIWGPLNSTGTASAVWALTLLVVFADRQWTAWLRLSAATVLSIALCLTLVRINWLMFVAGVLMFPLVRGRRSLATSLGAIVTVAGVLLIVMVLPGGERVTDRLGTFGNLGEDGSLNDRGAASQKMLERIFDQPWGRGMGFKTAGKVSGASVGIDAVDNGYGDIFMTLGLPGGMAFLLGLVLLTIEQARSNRRLRLLPLSRAGYFRPVVVSLSLILPTLLLLANFAAFSFGGAPAVLCWLIVGLANGQADAPRGAAAEVSQASRAGPPRSVSGRPA